MIRTTPSLPAIVGRVLLLTMVAAFLANVTGVNGRGSGSRSRHSDVKPLIGPARQDPSPPSSSSSPSTPAKIDDAKVVDNNETNFGSSKRPSGGASGSESRVRKRSKWSSHQSSAFNINKEGTFLKRIVTEVIAERDAQIAAALFEVAKNQPHLQMMVQTLGELSQSNQRLELSSTRLDETQRRLDSRMGVISEKMTLLETRVGQTERRIEREMTHVHGKLDDFFRGISNNFPEKPNDSLMRVVKQLQNQVNEIEELLQGRSTSNGHPTSKLRSKSGRHAARTGPSSSHSSAELQRLGNSLSQALAAAHSDLVRVVRESETNLDHQLSMLASDNGVFSCAISRLMERSNLVASGSGEPVNSIQQTLDTSAMETFATNGTRCILKCS